MKTGATAGDGGAQIRSFTFLNKKIVSSSEKIKCLNQLPFW